MDTIRGIPIDNLLYTTEGAESAQKSKEELDIPDPAPERALGVLSEDDEDEQATD